MKYKPTIIVISVLTIAFITIYLIIIEGHRKLPEVSNYSIVSNTGSPIPAKLYSRNVKSKINNKEDIINEYILCFSDTLISNESNLSGDEKLYKYLVIVPNLKMIGLVDNMNSLKEKDKYISQDDDEAHNFTSMINNNTFFTKPPIWEASFTNQKIIFNTYGVLKMFGESIVIETGKVPN